MADLASKDVQYAWAAGLFEGEGSSYIRSSSRTVKGIEYTYSYLRLNLSSTDLDVVERFQACLEYGTINGPYQGKGNKKPYWAWTCSNKERIIEFISTISPYLCLRRRTNLIDGYIKTYGKKEVA